jgi:hypothetical protein
MSAFRLNRSTALALGCAGVAARRVKPLGRPPANSVRVLARLERLDLGKDRAWLADIHNFKP